jgi:D-alanyl-D-alanine carboxypeptidase (penicillin-binding protein 5/6)
MLLQPFQNTPNFRTLSRMVQALLTVVFFGMVPLPGTGSAFAVSPLDVAVGSPSPIASLLSPFLEENANFSASGIVVMDLESGQVLFDEHADEQFPMASLTKLMTALLTSEKNMDFNTWVEIPTDLPPLESKRVLPSGEHFRLGDVLTALLVHSSNEAAVTLARTIAGSDNAFVEQMNTRAKELGLTHTSFSDAIGFDSPSQHSSAKDLAWLATYVLRRPELRKRLSLPSASIQSREGTVVALDQTHQLLTGNGPVIAGKTGTTVGAGQCLLSIVEQDSRDLVVVLLGSRNRYRDMQSLLSLLQKLPE